jgi:hypothetical protein
LIEALWKTVSNCKESKMDLRLLKNLDASVDIGDEAGGDAGYGGSRKSMKVKMMNAFGSSPLTEQQIIHKMTGFSSFGKIDESLN